MANKPTWEEAHWREKIRERILAVYPNLYSISDDYGQKITVYKERKERIEHYYAGEIAEYNMRVLLHILNSVPEDKRDKVLAALIDNEGE